LTAAEPAPKSVPQLAAAFSTAAKLASEPASQSVRAFVAAADPAAKSASQPAAASPTAADLASEPASQPAAAFVAAAKPASQPAAAKSAAAQPAAQPATAQPATAQPAANPASQYTTVVAAEPAAEPATAEPAAAESAAPTSASGWKLAAATPATFDGLGESNATTGDPSAFSQITVAAILGAVLGLCICVGMTYFFVYSRRRDQAYRKNLADALAADAARAGGEAGLVVITLAPPPLPQRRHRRSTLQDVHIEDPTAGFTVVVGPVWR
ncbi:hypothetical protein T492DRAFT_885343, partial [Pavlovales sp. CCMP2436]